jgi:hypothetical protein
MISPIAIALALAFWAPYNGGVPPCQGLQPQIYQGMKVQGTNQEAYGWTHRGYHQCDDLHLSSVFLSMPVSAQCEVIAHELGHRYFDLPDSLDRKNIMYGYNFIHPRGCNHALPKGQFDIY